MNKIGMIAIVAALSVGLFGYQYHTTSKAAPAVDVGAPVQIESTMKLAASLTPQEAPLSVAAVFPAEAFPEAIPAPLVEKVGGFVAGRTEVKVPANVKAKRSSSPAPKKSATRTKTKDRPKNVSPFKQKRSPLTSALNQKFHAKTMFPFSGVVRKDVKPGRQITKRVNKG
jgi:hypothetical protein